MASSRQLHVPRDYPTIQGAIDAADPGDTVKVAAGTYTESVQLRPGVCLLGSGARRTILDAGGQGRTLVDLTGAPGSVVAGFTMRGTAWKPGCSSTDPFDCSGNWYTAGVYLGYSTAFGWDDPTKDAPPIIANNIFQSNYIGVMLYHHGIAVVRNNVFVGNRNGFVANHYQDRTLLANNVFAGNTELAIGNQAAYLDIIDNIIVHSRLGIRFEYIQTGHIACNVFFGNGANASEPRFTIGSNGNVEAEPRFVGNDDYHLQPTSPAKNAGCHKNKVIEPDGTAPDIGAFGGPLSVWADL
jgi:nitrous oxidase accessory protein NosD